MRIISIFILLCTSCCAPFGTNLRTGRVTNSKPDDCQVKIYLNDSPKDCEIIGQVEAYGMAPYCILIPQLKVQACKLGSNAVMSLEYRTNDSRVNSDLPGFISNTVLGVAAICK